MAKSNKKLVGNARTGTVGTMSKGNKPREQAARAKYGVRTQGDCSGHEKCRNCGKSRA